MQFPRAVASDNKASVPEIALEAADSRHCSEEASTSALLAAPVDDAVPAVAHADHSHGFEKLKEVFTKYGPLALGFHFTVWSATLGSSFALLSTGFDVESLLPAKVLTMLPAGAGNLAVAYVITEVTGPFRTLLTLGAAPVLGRTLDQEKNKDQETVKEVSEER